MNFPHSAHVVTHARLSVKHKHAALSNGLGAPQAVLTAAMKAFDADNALILGGLILLECQIECAWEEGAVFGPDKREDV